MPVISLSCTVSMCLSALQRTAISCPTAMPISIEYSARGSYVNAMPQRRILSQTCITRFWLAACNACRPSGATTDGLTIPFAVLATMLCVCRPWRW